jgi:penicillin-binding protein-related factor A (putative recombinase)
MSALRRVRAGHAAKSFGRAFENLILSCAGRDAVTVIRIPDGCETRRGPRGLQLVRVRTPFDYVALKNGYAVVFDAKTVDGSTFPRSACTPHQLHSLGVCAVNAVRSGYVIWYRETDEVAFHPIHHLRKLKPRQSLKATDGLIIGRSHSIRLGALFDQSHHLDLTAEPL